MRGFAEAMEIIPYTLAENAGLNPIAVVTELRNRHAKGEKNAGINVRKVWAHAVGSCIYIPMTSLDTFVMCTFLPVAGYHY